MDYEEFAEYLSENYDLYSNSEIAKFLNVGPSAVANWKVRGKVPTKYWRKVKIKNTELIYEENEKKELLKQIETLNTKNEDLLSENRNLIQQQILQHILETDVHFTFKIQINPIQRITTTLLDYSDFGSDIFADKLGFTTTEMEKIFKSDMNKSHGMGDSNLSKLITKQSLGSAVKIGKNAYKLLKSIAKNKGSEFVLPLNLVYKKKSGGTIKASANMVVSLKDMLLKVHIKFEEEDIGYEQ